MGLRGSCMIARSITNVVTDRALLPPDRRLLLFVPMPIWASILDDIWVTYR